MQLCTAQASQGSLAQVLPSAAELREVLYDPLPPRSAEVVAALEGELQRVRAEVEEGVGREEEGVLSELELRGYFQEQDMEDRVRAAALRFSSLRVALQENHSSLSWCWEVSLRQWG